MQVLCGLQGIFLLFNCQTPEHSVSGIYKEYCLAAFVMRNYLNGFGFTIFFEKRIGENFKLCYTKTYLYNEC